MGQNFLCIEFCGKCAPKNHVVAWIVAKVYTRQRTFSQFEAQRISGLICKSVKSKSGELTGVDCPVLTGKTRDGSKRGIDIL